MEAPDTSKIKGTKEVPTVVDSPQVGGVRVVLGAGKGKPQNVGIVVGRATRRASVERNRLIRTKTDQAKAAPRDIRDRTTSKAQSRPEQVLHF